MNQLNNFTKIILDGTSLILQINIYFYIKKNNNLFNLRQN